MKNKIIDLTIFNEVYEMNKKLDDMFIKKYDHPEFVKKNKLELLVEIGELANESGCFKYWSSKEKNHDLIGFELADCFIMTLSFFNSLKIDLEEYNYGIDNCDVIDLFFTVYQLALDFIKTDNCDILKKLLVFLIYLSYKLGFNDEEIIDYCKKKIAIDYERFENE